MPEDRNAAGAGAGARGGRGAPGGAGGRGGRGAGGRGGPGGAGGRGPGGEGAAAGAGARRGGRDGARRRRGEGEPREREFTETMISAFRCSATVKGGRRLSFGSLVCVGDGKGRVGVGYGKAKEVPGAYQKAIKQGRRNLVRFPIAEGGTIPHQIEGRFGASRVMLIPAMPGTGVIAGTAVKAILEAGGLTNILTKSHGNTNTRNIVKAVINALENLRSKEMVENLRGVKLD